MTNHTRTKNIGGDSIYFCAHPSRAKNRYDSHDYACGGNFEAKRIALKVLNSGFYWHSLLKDAYLYCQTCDRCQKVGNLGARNQIPQSSIFLVKLFDVWGIDFMVPFPSSIGNEYILQAVDYVSK